MEDTPEPTVPLSREQAADIFEEIALLMELQGENPFKIRAYKQGADIVRSFPGDIMKLAATRDLPKISGLGEALRDKLEEMALTGDLGFYRNLRQAFPETLFELFDITGLGPKKIKALYETLGIDSLVKLKGACESGVVATLAGFGKKSAENILLAIASKEKHAGRFRVDEAGRAVAMIEDWLRQQPQATRWEVAGSWRRGRETVGDLDFLVSSRNGAALVSDFCRAAFVEQILANGDTKGSVLLANGLQCDLRVVEEPAFPFALQYFTGSKEHNVALRSRALKQGYSLNEYRLTPTSADGAAPPVLPDEAALYRFLGLDWIPPELRENQGEMAAAEAGRLPRLIETGQLRGTFHNHTTASDGNNTVKEMGEAARDLGLQYLGIADHSRSSFQANGLDEERLRAQIKEIRQFNREWDDFQLLAGSEVDIHKDGTLDFNDDLLAELDYVVASVHQGFTMSQADITARIIKAMDHPSVDMLGHLTGRLLLRRDSYAVDVPAIIEAAADTGTILELNANPWRLELDWRWWPLAKEKGVKCVINPDAHRLEGLQDLYHGVRIARKGWLTRGDVVNTMSLEKVREFLALSKSQRKEFEWR